MFPYSMLQIVFFFFVYCFFGWIIESTWVSLHQKKFVNRGFLRGPFIPIYGCGAMTLILSCANLLKWPVAVFFVGMIAASILEYFTGVAMEAIFKVRYWDYSNSFMNINGHVCLFCSVAWGFLSLLANYFIHTYVVKLSVLLGEQLLSIITGIIAIYFVVDLTLSFKAAMDLRDAIIYLEKAKEEMRHMQKRLDVLMAYANQDFEEQKEKVQDKFEAISDGIAETVDNIGDHIEDLSDSVEEKLANLRKALEEKPQAFADSIRNEYMDLQTKFMVKKDGHFGLARFASGYKKGLVLGNPSLGSKKFKGSVESIKNYITKKDQ